MFISSGVVTKTHCNCNAATAPDLMKVTPCFQFKIFCYAGSIPRRRYLSLIVHLDWISHRTGNILHDSCLLMFNCNGSVSWCLEATRFEFRLFQLLWHLTSTSTAVLPRCLSNVRAIQLSWHPNSRLQEFTIFGGKTSYRLVNRGPGSWVMTGVELLVDVIHESKTISYTELPCTKGLIVMCVCVKHLDYHWSM